MTFKSCKFLKERICFNKIIIILSVSLSQWNCDAPKQSSFTLTVEVIPAEGGVVTGLDDNSFDNGASITLTAVPAEGYYFHSWSGDESGNKNPKTIVIYSDKTIQANFTKHVYPLSMMDNYSDLNKNTSWYITNKEFNYFNIKYSTYAHFAQDDGSIRPVWNNQCCDSTWTGEIGGYIYADLNDDGALDLWQYYYKHPWPSDMAGIHMYSENVDNIIQTPQGTYDPNDYYATFGLHQVRKQILSDINNDGRNEIILFSHGYDAYPFPGDSIGIFYPTTKDYRFLSDDIGFFHGGAAADVDKNGYVDIIAFSGWSAIIDPHPILYQNFGNNSFNLNNAMFTNFEGKNFYEVELFDINADNNIDLFLTAGNELYAVLGNELGEFDFTNNIDFHDFVNDNLAPMDINFFDFNQDGKKDILLLNNLNSYNGHSLKILLQLENENTFVDSTDRYVDEYSTSANDFWVKWLYLSDIDQDGDIDLVADGLFGESGNHNLDILYWENISGFFHRRQESASITF